MQIRLRWRAERRKYKMSDSEEDVMLIGLYVISNKKKTPHIKKQKPVDPWCIYDNVNLARTLWLVGPWICNSRWRPLRGVRRVDARSENAPLVSSLDGLPQLSVILTRAVSANITSFSK